MPNKRFERDDMARFLDLLPVEFAGRPLRHVLEPRHDSFAAPEFIDLCRERGVAICASDHESYPLIRTSTSDFVYARLMRLREDELTGYPPNALAIWADRLSDAAAGRDLFVFFIGAGEVGKVRAPAAAQAFLDILGCAPPVSPSAG